MHHLYHSWNVQIQEKPGQLQWRCREVCVGRSLCWGTLTCFQSSSSVLLWDQIDQIQPIPKKRNQKLMARDQRMKHLACILHTHRLMFSFFAKKISKLYLLTHCVVRTLEMRQQTSVVCSHAFPDREHSSRCFHHVQPHAAIFDQFHQLDDHSIMGS